MTRPSQAPLLPRAPLAEAPAPGPREAAGRWRARVARAGILAGLVLAAPLPWSAGSWSGGAWSFGAAQAQSAAPEVAPDAAPEAIPDAKADAAKPAAALTPDMQKLLDVLELPAVLGIMQKEGEDYGASIEEDMFPEAGGRAWAAQVEAIYAPERVMPGFNTAFAAALEGADVPAMLRFFDSELGHRVVRLEVAARRELLDDAVSDAADQHFAEMVKDNDPRVALLEAFATAGDLIEANVQGGLNANLKFFAGMKAGGVFKMPGAAAMDEGELLAQVWSQEDAVRTQAREWLYPYLALAYQPLSDDELRRYIAFSESPAGRALNGALFAGFDQVFDDVSFALGRSVAHYLTGTDL